jgi:hypothetical protein
MIDCMRFSEEVSFTTGPFNIGNMVKKTFSSL